jgi:hypothetical protein
MKNAVLWDVAPCRSSVSRRFRRTYRLHLQGRKIRDRGTIVSKWRYVPPKRRFTQDLHGATSQKTAFLIVTAVKTSNLLFSIGATAPIWALAYLHETLRFTSVSLDLRHSVGLLGRVILSSKGLYLYTNTEKRAHVHKH